MKTIGIIAEYNPFHNGHAFQIREAKAQTGADFVCVVMSPDFVQRGTYSVSDKYTRTETALHGGADVVLELPVRYAAAGARDFAAGAVGILHQINCIDYLSFGCETPQTAALSDAASVLVKEPEALTASLRKGLKTGMGFAAARESALKEFAETNSVPELISFLETGQLRMPNNILAIEYLAAIRKYHSDIIPLPVRRVHAGYHQKISPESRTGRTSSPEQIASAEGIRELLLNGETEAARSFIPEASQPPLFHAIQISGFPSSDFYSRLLRFRLQEEKDYSRFEDISPALSGRISSNLNAYTDAESFSSFLQTRVFPKTHIDRALLHILLSLEKTERTDGMIQPPGYVRILGFRRDAAAFLREMQEVSSIPVITKPAAAKKTLSEPALSRFEEDLHASHVYQLLFRSEVLEEYTRSPVIV